MVGGAPAVDQALGFQAPDHRAQSAFAVYLIAYRFSAANVFWALVFSVNNRRDTWLPANESARAYLDLGKLPDR